MHCFGMLLDGRAQPTGVRKRGDDRTLLIIFNSHYDLVNFTLPESAGQATWILLIDTNVPEHPGEEEFATGHVYQVTGRSVLVFAMDSDEHTP